MSHPTYPAWVLDDSPIPDPEGRGEAAVRFLSQLKNSYTDGKPMGLPRFWERIIRMIYGPSDDYGQRLYREVFIMIPRGARKTTIAAGLGLFHTIGKEGRRDRGQIIVAASAKKQAFNLFLEAKDMVESTPWITSPDGKSVAKVRGSGRQAAEDPYIEHPDSQSVLSIASSDGGSSHGTTPYVSIFDELHAFKNGVLFDALASGLIKTPETLSITITTAGRGQTGIAWEQYCRARDIASGKVRNPRYLPVLFEPPSVEADWRDRNLWQLVNPGLREGFPDLVGFEKEALGAEESNANRDRFKQYNLNFWLAQSTSPFVSMSLWDQGDAPVDLDAHEQFRDPCWIGVDLGVSNDLSAVVACWRDPEVESGYEVAAWFFCADDNIDEKSDGDRFDYRKWAQHPNRYIIPTPGNITDHNRIREHIEELCGRFNVQEIVFDPAYGGQVMSSLTEAGYPVVQMQQGWRSMSPAIAELERSLIANRFSHGGNPVLRWNIENVTVNTDSAGNRTFHKGKSTGRIDGAVATVMAVARAYANSAADVAPTPFYLEAGFDVASALGIDGEESGGTDDDSELDAKIRAMLEDD